MKNTDTNFDIEERTRKSMFIDREGDWTSYTNGMGSMAEQLGCFIEFGILIGDSSALCFGSLGSQTISYSIEHIFNGG